MRTSTWILLTLLVWGGVCNGEDDNETPTVTITSSPGYPTDEPSYKEFKTFTSAILNSTNTYREQHNVSSLAWNSTLAKFAADWVDRSCKMEHSGGPYGENLAIGYQNATAAVEAWGDERDMFDFKDGGFSKKTGHFTQLVWKTSRQVGCGRKDCGEGKGWYLACEYYPGGNVQGQYREEVLEQVSGPDTGDDDGEESGGTREVERIGTAWVAGVTIVCYGLIGLVVFAEWSPP